MPCNSPKSWYSSTMGSKHVALVRTLPSSAVAASRFRVKHGCSRDLGLAGKSEALLGWIIFKALRA